MSNFEPDVLEPDRCKVELRMESSVAYLYGALIRTFMHVKEVGNQFEICTGVKFHPPSFIGHRGTRHVNGTQC
jgi:hypothetical protein